MAFKIVRIDFLYLGEIIYTYIKLKKTLFIKTKAI